SKRDVAMHTQILHRFKGRSRMAGFCRKTSQSPRFSDRPVWVGTSSWQNGEAAVHRRLTLERQMNSTLLPDCAINTPAAEAE
ncbi:MAG: hypothetical protein KA800_13495, partial [Thauera sp.]|nr:hypothetical protein [Thauera sp.]